MSELVNKDLLLKSFYKHKLYLKTGMDRVSAEKFESIKDSEIELIIKKVNNDTYRFTRYLEYRTDKGRLVYSATIRDRILLDVLKDKIRKKYKIKPPNRKKICLEIKRTLMVGHNLTILKFDIEKFYESIKSNILFKILKDDSRLSEKEYKLIQKSFIQKNSGVFQGLPTSNYLAEIYMKEFDNYASMTDSRICYYKRYVDDIIIILNGNLREDEVDALKKNLSLYLKKNLNLKFNDNKFSKTYFGDNENFCYLGYKFILNRYKNSYGKNCNVVNFQISEEKILKIEAKIEKFYSEFRKDRNFPVLEQRLKILTSLCYGLKFREKYLQDDKIGQCVNKLAFSVINTYRYSGQESFDELNKILKNNLDANKEVLTNKHRRLLDKYKFNIKKPKIIKFHKFETDDYRNLLGRMNKDILNLDQKDRKFLIFNYFKILKIKN